MIEISLVVPAYNETKRIGPTLASFSSALADTPHEIVVTDDGSTDGTPGFVAGLGIPGLRVVEGSGNRGKGHAVRRGMLAAVGRFRVMCDADGSTPADQLPALLAPLRSGEADLAIGSRYLPGSRIEIPQSVWRRRWSRLANRVNQALLLPGIVDTHCGFKAFTAEASEEVFPRCEIDGWSSDLETLAIARALGLRIREVPVRWADDAASRGRLSHLPKAIAELFWIWRKTRIFEIPEGRVGDDAKRSDEPLRDRWVSPRDRSGSAPPR